MAAFDIDPEFIALVDAQCQAQGLRRSLAAEQKRQWTLLLAELMS